MLSSDRFRLGKRTTFDCTGILSNSEGEMNSYTGKNIFEDENYQIVIDWLNGGYISAKNLLVSMKAYVELRHEHPDRLSSLSKKCRARLNQQSPLSTYASTMTAELQIYQILEEQARIEEESCATIQRVIDNHSNHIDMMYPRARFNNTHKHYRAYEMKQRFKRARSPLRKVIVELAKLREKEKKISDAINNGTVASQNSNLHSTIDRQQNKLQDIQDDILLTEEKRRQKEAKYIIAATEIFKDCQELEKKRLEQIKETFIDFIQAIHPSQYSPALVQTYDKLLSDIKTQQNSINDVNYWSNIYARNRLTITVPSETNDNEHE